MLHFIHMKRSTKFLFFLTASVSLFVLQASFASAKTICIGQPTTFYWSGSNVSSCTATYSSNDCLFTSGSPAGGSITGSKSMSPSATCSATLTCSGGGASASDTDTLTVDTTKTWNGTACVTPPTASISQSSNVTLSQGLFSITWGSTNATSCTVDYSGPTTPGTLSSGPTSGTSNMSPQNTGTYTLTNTCVNGSLSASQSVSHKVVSGTVSGTTCTVASGASTCTTTITWTVAGTSFATLWDNVNSAARQGSGSGGNFVDTLSYNATRTYYVREGSLSTNFLIANTSVTPECATGTAWNGSVCAANTPSGSLTLSPMSCTIAVGASTCSTVYATWTTSNVSSAALVDRNVDSTLSTSLNRASPGLQVWVAYPSTTFDLKNTSAGTTLDTDIATASCASGSTWDGSVCAATPSPTATLTVPNCTIASGASTCTSSVSWTSANLTTTLSTRQNGTQFSTAAINTGTNRTLSYGSGASNTFTAVHNGSTLDTKTGTASCASGSTWNGSVCAANTPSGSLTLSPMSCTIAVGASTCSTVYATWTTSNVSSAALVDRNVDSTLSTSLNRASPGLQVWVAYPSTTFDLKNTSAGTTLDTDIATASCASGSTWDGSVCACPTGQTAVGGSCVTNPVLRNEAMNYPNITFVCDNSANYTVVRNEGSFSQSGSTTSGATITVPITMEGNYTLTCISGELTDSSTINYTQPIVTLAGMTITASPRTVNNNKNTTLSWSVLYPTNSCSLRAEVSCTGGHSLCSTEQLAAETALNSTLASGTTDANDPYGPERNIQTAVKTIAPENNPSNDKALGKKTILLNYTTDFILDCGGSLIKKTRVNVASDNEG